MISKLLFRYRVTDDGVRRQNSPALDAGNRFQIKYPRFDAKSSFRHVFLWKKWNLNWNIRRFGVIVKRPFLARAFRPRMDTHIPCAPGSG